MLKNKKSSHWRCLSWHILTFCRKQWGVEKCLSNDHNCWKQNESRISQRFMWQTRTQCWDSTACSCAYHWGPNHVLVKGRKGEHQARIWFAKSDAVVNEKFGLWQVQIIRKIMWAQQVPLCAKVQVGVSIFLGIMKDRVLPPRGDYWLGWWGLWW